MDFERLYFLREYANMTQESLGKVFNVSKYCICNWEKGKEIIPLKKLNEYSKYFNVSMDYILKISDNKNINYDYIELDKKTIGEKLKDVRLAHNLTQRELAKILNTDHTVIGKYERGVNLILTAFAYQICMEFKISLDWLCGKCDNPIIK